MTKLLPHSHKVNMPVSTQPKNTTNGNHSTTSENSIACDAMQIRLNSLQRRKRHSRDSICINTNEITAHSNESSSYTTPVIAKQKYIFICFLSYQVKNPETKSFTKCNSKKQILSQSQMFKASCA